MKYKAIILDLDGTTVPNSSELPPSKKVSTAIARAKEKIHVCIATGRPLFIAKPIIDHLELSGPCVINNGTQIYDPQKNEIVSEHPLSPKVVPKVLRIFQSFRHRPSLFNGVTDVPLDGADSETAVFSVFLPEISPEDADKLTEKLKKIPNISTHKMPSWEKESHFAFEVTDGQATKLHGIVEITEILKVKKEEVIGVGDSYNDFPLLMASGLKIAMGNAVAELKEIADFVAPSVEEDGVATVIEKFILSA